MSESQIFEVHRLAQAANSKADSADHKAQLAQSDIAHHEKICAERYNNINTQLGDIKTAASKAAEGQKESTGKLYDAIHRIEVQVAGMAAAGATKTGTTDNLLKWGGWVVAGLFGLIKLATILT